jgi:hypothetical protein
LEFSLQLAPHIQSSKTKFKARLVLLGELGGLEVFRKMKNKK